MNNLYETIYNDLKAYLLTNSIYKPTITKIEPNEVSKFPLVTCVEGDYDYSYTTLKYGDELYNYNLMTINVFAQNATINNEKVSGVTIKNEIRNLIEVYFKTKYKMKLKVTPNAPNVDDSIFRSIIRVQCAIDTKFKDKLIIYPR